MRLVNTFRAISQVTAATAALWALAASPLMLFGVHGVSSDHDKSLGKVCLLGGIVFSSEFGGLRKNIPGQRSDSGSADRHEQSSA
jgi:hypothetical protein